MFETEKKHYIMLHIIDKHNTHFPQEETYFNHWVLEWGTGSF